MTRGLFIAGTDTDVGKTVVAAGLLRMLRKRGLDAYPMKPVQTGAEMADGVLRAPDLECCITAADLNPSEEERELMAPFLYRPACSPHLAGRMSGAHPDIERIVQCYDDLGRTHECVLVEGAGGVFAPLDEERTMLDLMQKLGAPVLLVSRGALGAINHSLLSLAVLREAGLRVIGVVVNDPAPAAGDFIRRENPAAIAQFGKAAILGDLTFAGDLAEGDWGWFERGMTGFDIILNELRVK